MTAETPPGVVPDGDDADTLDDQAAELDEDVADPDDTTEGVELDDDDGADISGLCIGGPYDGRTVTSRFPKGFLLADKAGAMAYVYDWADGSFTCREPHGAALDPDGRWLAAGQDTYDVIAYDADPAAVVEVHP